MKSVRRYPSYRKNPIHAPSLTSWGLHKSEELHTLMEKFRTDTAQGDVESALQTLKNIEDKANAFRAALESSLED